MADISCCRCTGSGTGACLVGEEPAFRAIHKYGPEAAGNCLTQSEGLCKNTLKHGRKPAEVFYNDKQSDQKIKACHNRYNHIQNFYCGIFPKYDDCCYQHQKDGSIDRRNLKCIFKCGGYRVADDLADTAPADKAGKGK